MRRLGRFVALSLSACSGSYAPRELPAGPWGGEHVSLTVSATGARVEFDCAHGTVDEAPRLDAEGQFSLSGSYVREHGGPIHQGEPEDRHPAHYFGELRGSRLTLSIRLADEGTQIGPYQAQSGQPPRLIKCR
jgi:hypothetical protein